MNVQFRVLSLDTVGQFCAKKTVSNHRNPLRVRFIANVFELLIVWYLKFESLNTWRKTEELHLSDRRSSSARVHLHPVAPSTFLDALL